MGAVRRGGLGLGDFFSIELFHSSILSSMSCRVLKSTRTRRLSIGLERSSAVTTYSTRTVVAAVVTVLIQALVHLC